MMLELVELDNDVMTVLKRADFAKLFFKNLKTSKNPIQKETNLEVEICLICIRF